MDKNVSFLVNMHELYFLNLSFISFNNVCERDTERDTETDTEMERQR